MKRIGLTLVFVLGLVAARASQTSATTLGIATQNGDIFKLENLGSTVDTLDGDSDAWLLRLTIDTSGHTLNTTANPHDPQPFYFSAVALSTGGPYDNAGLFGTSFGASSVWSYVSGGTSSAGCTTPSNAFVCASYSSGDKALDTGGTYSWTWIIDNPTFDPKGYWVKAVWVDANGDFVDQISSGVSNNTSVPEPATALLLGLGMLGVAAVRRKRSA